MAFHDEDVEKLDCDALDRLQRRKFDEMLRVVLSTNAFYIRKLAGIRFDPLVDPIESFPFTTREELQEDQREHAPYGSNLTFPPDHYPRMHQTSASSGGAPLRWLDTAESWNWFKRCWGVIYEAAGVQSGDRFLFPFSFGPFVGFWAAFESACERGCLTLAAGGLSTVARLHMILENAVTVLGCTPTYALRMAEVAQAEGIDIVGSAVRALIVAGEPGGCIAATRAAIESKWNARVFDHTGMTEIGSCSFECVEAPGGVHIIESEFIPEVIDPESGKRCPEGQAGELVLTNLGRVGSPLIRYRTGDVVRMLRQRCACGRWFARLDGGILGRSDDMLLIRGNNVFPSAVEEVVRRLPIVEFRLVTSVGVPSTDLLIEIETPPGSNSENIAEALRNGIRDRLNFKPVVTVVDPGTLPRYEMKSRRLIRR